MAERFVKLYRKMIKWEWYKDTNTKALFTHLLLTANWKDEKWQGIVVKRGQVVVGRKKLSQETGLSEREIRTSLEHLKSTNEIAIKTTNKYSLITIVKYEDYQEDKTKTTNTSTNNQSNNRPATDHNNRIYRNSRESRVENFTPPSLSEIISYGSETRIKKDYCERFYNYYVNNNWKSVKDWKAKFNYWISKEKNKDEVYEKETSSRRLG